MALPLAPGLTPPEVAFLCEMELVTVIPRQKLEGLALLGVGQPRQYPATDYLKLQYQASMSADARVNADLTATGLPSTAQSAASNQHTALARAAAEAPTPREHPRPAMAQPSFADRNTRPRD